MGFFYVYHKWLFKSSTWTAIPEGKKDLKKAELLSMGPKRLSLKEGCDTELLNRGEPPKQRGGQIHLKALSLEPEAVLAAQA